MGVLRFGRIVLGAAATLLGAIASKYLADPVGAVAEHRIVLGSAEAVTIMRVSGGVFLGIALVLVGCALSERRVLTGLGVLATVAGAITAARLLGLALDGPAPFTLFVLKPELGLVAASTTAFLLERRRARPRVPAADVRRDGR
jgi:uncharacterized protein DUF4345